MDAGTRDRLLRMAGVEARALVLASATGLADGVPYKGETVRDTASAHTGAMVALVPTAENADRLALDGFEPADELHVTLAHLGDAADFTAEMRIAIVAGVEALAEDAIRPDYDFPLTADAFAVSVFNPDDDDACLVLGLSGVELAEVRDLVVDQLESSAGEAMLAQHQPWVPHITLAYTADADMIEELFDLVGPVYFDRIRVAFGDEVTDIPLGDVVHALATRDPSDVEAAVTDTAVSRHRTLRLLGVVGEERKFNPGQKRRGAGTVGGGQWVSIEDRVMADLRAWLKGGGPSTGNDPLAVYSQPQLKTAAQRLGLNPPSGMRLVPLKNLLITHAHAQNGSTGPVLTPGLVSTPAPPVVPIARKVPVSIAGIAGVTSTKVAVPSGHQQSINLHGAKQSQEIRVNGVLVGTVHQYTGSLGWIADDPKGNQLVSSSSQNRSDAIKALIAAHSGSPSGTTPAFGSTPLHGGAPNLPSVSPSALVGPPAGATKVSAAVAGIQGVYQVVVPAKPLPAGSPSWAKPSKRSFELYLGGTKLGRIDEQTGGYWHAESPKGGYVPGAGSTKTSAVKAVIAHHQAVSANAANANTMTSVPGVTLRSISPMSSHYGAVSLGVDYQGVSIGAIHTGSSVGWTAFPPTGATYGLQGGPGTGHTFMNKDAALKALVAAHNAAQSVPATPTAQGFTTKPARNAANMMQTLSVSYGGIDLGNISENSSGRWFAETSGGTWGWGTLPNQPHNGYANQADVMKALKDNYEATYGTIVLAQPLSAFGHAPEVQSALDVIYGADPKGKTAVRQLAVYGGLRRAQFDSLESAEKSTLLGDLSYIATTAKGANAVKAQKIIDRFTPPGTAPGSVPTQAIIPPASAVAAQSRVQDPAGTVGLLSVLPSGKRGRNGDGWTRSASGGTGPWGQYGAAGLMLRHVDDNGDERFLMVERGPGISDPGKWQFPGGAKDELETFHEGAAREVVEELGFKPSDVDAARVHGTHTNEVASVMVPGPNGGKVPWAYVSIAATVPTQLTPDLSTHHARAETSDAKWMTRAEIAQLDGKGKLLRPLAGGQLSQNVLSLFPPAARVARPGPVTTRPPRLAGAPKPAPLAHKPSRGVDMLADKSATNKLRQDVKAARPSYAGKVADDRLAAIGAMQGFDDTPTVVSKAEMDRLLATGQYIEAWRGVQGVGGRRLSGSNRAGGAISKSKTAAEINEEFRSGPAYYGTGMFGNGYYFATIRSIAEGYSDASRGSVARVLIPRKAKISDHSAIQSQAHAASSPRTKAKGSFENGTLYDEGRYAAAKGIDALEIQHNNFNGASHVARPGKPAYNILNRSVLIVEEA